MVVKCKLKKNGPKKFFKNDTIVKFIEKELKVNDNNNRLQTHVWFAWSKDCRVCSHILFKKVYDD